MAGLTHDQHVCSSDWSRWGSDGFPIRKAGSSKWIIVVDSTSVWAPIGTNFPIVFKTKRAAIEFFENLCTERFREWRLS